MSGRDLQKKTEVLQNDVAGIQRAIDLLASGGTVALPTETVYGLAANALDEASVRKIYTAKERPSYDPLIVHVAGPQANWALWVKEGWLDSSVMSPNVLQTLNTWTQLHWPGPLTLILPKGPAIPNAVSSGLSSVGFRMPKSDAMQKILNQIAFPLAAPSANRFGRISPTTAQHVLLELNGAIDAILDGGPCTIGVESTIVRPNILDGSITSLELLRPGAVDPKKLADSTGTLFHTPQNTVLSNKMAPEAPGMLDSHYAPRTPTIWARAPIHSVPVKERIAVLTLPLISKLDADWMSHQQKNVLKREALPTNPTEAAHHLYSILRRLDALNADQILILGDLPNLELDPLWRSIADRLTRASHS
jgi:L-threonylcarbamoyladenylate synthase